MRRFLTGGFRGAAPALTAAIAVVVFSGCGTVSNAAKSDSALLAASRPSLPAAVPLEPAVSGESLAPAESSAEIETPPPLGAGDGEDEGGGAESAAVQVAQTQRSTQEKIDTSTVVDAEEEYDPWEPFNEKMFEFNRRLDRYAFKPVAKAYNVVMPEPFQVLIANGFDNISFVPRTINSLLQWKWGGVGRELSRFLINSTAGIGGLFDAAKYWGIEKSREDFGQTLGVWGVGPGPYLIVPFMEPLTVRDGIGKAVDGLMDPASYFLPFLWTRLGMKVGDMVNDRSLNLELFQGFEESVIDMYSAVRHGYLRRREQLIKE